MVSKFKKHIMSIAVLAVALVQLFGIQSGYFCECSGTRSAEAICVGEVCHPEQGSAHLEDGTEHPDHQHPDAPQDHQDHPHKEVRERLILAALPPLLHPPVPVFFDLPSCWQLPDFTMLMASFAKKTSQPPPEDGSPPMPQLVARTIVILI